MLEKMRTYPVGSIVQHRDHYIFVKGEDKAWTAQHRWMVAQKGDATGKSGDLAPGERVYHLNGQKDDNRPKNLIRIQFDQTEYYAKPLKTSRPIHIPKVAIPRREVVKR